MLEESDDVLIRPERPDDRRAIFVVNEVAFDGADEARLVDALRDHGRLTISLVAEVDGVVVGHIGFSPVTLDGARDGIGLAPLAVLPESQRRGIGARLVREGLARCRDHGSAFVVVLGSPAYYGRFGFTTASVRGLSDEFGGGDAFQVLECRPGALPSTGGLVRYASEFAEL